jgi:hypothetical protein
MNEGIRNTSTVTASEREAARRAAEKAMRTRLEARKPDAAAYATDATRAARLIGATLLWAKAAVPIIALLAAVASAVRTVQTASEIYAAAGSHPLGVLLAALAFTLATEGALFTLALAQEGEHMKRRAAGAGRHVPSLAGLWRAVLVRVGARPPLRYDELPERDGIGVVMLIALVFAVSANAYMGLRPLVEQIGAASLQAFLASIVTASAELQLTFIVDFAAVLFPPLMALKAGHLTARFAAEIAAASSAGQNALDRDLAAWRAAVADPLATGEGRELYQELLAEKAAAKAGKTAKGRGRKAADVVARNGHSEGELADFLAMPPSFEAGEGEG